MYAIRSYYAGRRWPWTINPCCGGRDWRRTQTARARLKVIYEHTDGFQIAREDLRIRGPGEFVGARQSA